MSTLSEGVEGVGPAAGDIAGEERILALELLQLAECLGEKTLCQASQTGRGPLQFLA